MEGNTLLRTHQYKYNDNEIGTMIEKNKIANQSVALKKIRNRNDYLNEGISTLVSKNVSLNSSIQSLKNSIISAANSYKRQEMQKLANENKPKEQYYGED